VQHDTDTKDGTTPARPSYCRAYYLRELRAFPNWREVRVSWDHDDRHGSVSPDKVDESTIVYIHEDFTVTASIIKDENVILIEVTPEWETFVRQRLGFTVPVGLLSHSE
jgi:hypothetical protein